MGRYFVVQDWMIMKLKLKGLERDLFAIIYGFSQDGHSYYRASLNYMSEMTGYSKQAVITAIKKLLDKNYITKAEEPDGTMRYQSKYTEGSQETLQGSQETLLPGSQETLLNNNINKNNKLLNKFNNYKNSDPKPNLYSSCIAMIDEFIDSKKERLYSGFIYEGNLRDVLVDYLNMRLENKERPLYKNMWKGLLRKLDDCYQASSPKCYSAIVRQSLEKGYNTFYPYNDNANSTVRWKETYNEDAKDYERTNEKF